MCEKFPVNVCFMIYEIYESQISKNELRKRIEKMLEEYPEDTMFDRAWGSISLGVLESETTPPDL